MLEQYISFPIIWCHFFENCSNPSCSWITVTTDEDHQHHHDQHHATMPALTNTITMTDLGICWSSSPAILVWISERPNQTWKDMDNNSIMWRNFHLIVKIVHWNKKMFFWWTNCIFCVENEIWFTEKKNRNMMYDHKRIIIITLSMRMRQMTTGARKITKKRTRM